MLPIHEMHPPGAAVFGWPLLWSIPMIPIRAVGLDPNPDVAFVLGIALTLVALAVAVVATAYVGLYATGRRSVGLIAAGSSPSGRSLSGQLAGHSAWENGQWNVDVGLHLYTEPLSTALVVASVALLLRPATAAARARGRRARDRLRDGREADERRRRARARRSRRVAPRLATGAAVCAWAASSRSRSSSPTGRRATSACSTGRRPRRRTPGRCRTPTTPGRHSLLFTPRLLLLLAPLLRDRLLRDPRSLGCWPSCPRRSSSTSVVYSFYYVTALHPRFLYVTLPFVFVLEAAGAVAVVDAVRRRQRLGAQVRVL